MQDPTAPLYPVIETVNQKNPEFVPTMERSLSKNCATGIAIPYTGNETKDIAQIQQSEKSA